MKEKAVSFMSRLSMGDLSRVCYHWPQVGDRVQYVKLAGPGGGAAVAEQVASFFRAPTVRACGCISQRLHLLPRLLLLPLPPLLPLLPLLLLRPLLPMLYSCVGHALPRLPVRFIRPTVLDVGAVRGPLLRPQKRPVHRLRLVCRTRARGARPRLLLPSDGGTRRESPAEAQGTSLRLRRETRVSDGGAGHESPTEA